MIKQPIPIDEQICRWIDVFTYFDYNDTIRDNAKRYALQIIDFQKHLGPRSVALCGLIIACKKANIEFKLAKVNKILAVYLGDNKIKSGLRGGSFSRLKRRALEWESKLQLN